jgi:hypothetical protein
MVVEAKPRALEKTDSSNDKRNTGINPLTEHANRGKRCNDEKEREEDSRAKKRSKQLSYSNSRIVASTTSTAIAPPTSRGQAPRAEAFAYFLRL